MLRYRSSLERHFTPKASVICFPSVKGRFCSPSVPIYRSSGSNPWRGNKQAAGIRQSLFYSMVGRQGFSLLRRRPLRRFAPCALRWQTLTRLLSSAPRRVRTRGAATKKRPASASRFSILWWAVRGSACSAGGRCGASRLARCAGKRSRVYSAPRPDGFEPVHR